MRIEKIEPPRRYKVGRTEEIWLSDCAHIHLDPDEQVTLYTEAGGEYDVTRKDYGFYATPSLNSRLLRFGLRGVLVRNREGQYFILLIERGKDAEFAHYLQIEDLAVVCWLDDTRVLQDLERLARAGAAAGSICRFCSSSEVRTAHEYQERPKGETPFAFNADTPYRRTLTVCGGCGHYYSAHAWDEGSLYEDAYYDATYGAKLRQTYDRINALPPERSDNVARAARIDSYCRTRWAGQAAGARPHPTVLDVGSGLCVFLYRMKERGWAGTALDPGQTAITHAQEVVGVAGIRGDFFAVELLETYDLLTFNKVMEHVKDPVAMLRRCHELLTPGGLVYVELPDGEAAITDPDGPEREEFFIEHHHVFSAASLTLLAWQAEFQVLQLERIREPSGKYTLYAFLAPAVRGAGTVGPGRGD